MSEGSPPSERNGASDEAAPAPRSTIPEYSGSESAPMGAAPETGAYGGAPDAPDIAFPWPPAEGASVAAAFVQTWQAATFQPAALFRALPERASLGSALLYYLPLGIIIEGTELFWTIVRSRAEQDSTQSAVSAANMSLPPVVTFLLSPIALILLLFLAAAATHGLLKLFGGANRDYLTTTRVFAFTSSPMIFSVVPLIGVFIGSICMVVIATIGVREAHRTSTGRAATAVLAPFVLVGGLWALIRILRVAQTLLEMPV